MGGEYICQYPSNEGKVCGNPADRPEGVIFTGKDASELYANKMGV